MSDSDEFWVFSSGRSEFHILIKKTKTKKI